MKKLKLGSVLPHSGEICSLVRRTGWGLYDVTAFKGRAPDWTELNTLKAATELVCGDNYFFARTPKQGETLRDAYARTMGTGPCMKVELPEHPKWESLDVRHDHWIAVFSRLIVDEQYLVLMSPPDAPDMTDFIALRISDAVDTFLRHFGIIESIEHYMRGEFKPASSFPLLAA